MGIVGLSGSTKKDEEVQSSIEDMLANLEASQWYQPHCVKCPYLKRDEKAMMAHCNRPHGEPCLAESLLVQGLLQKEEFEFVKAQMEAIDAELTAKEEEAKKKFPKIKRKKIKLRRGGYM